MCSLYFDKGEDLGIVTVYRVAYSMTKRNECIWYNYLGISHLLAWHLCMQKQMKAAFKSKIDAFQ